MRLKTKQYLLSRRKLLTCVAALIAYPTIVKAGQMSLLGAGKASGGAPPPAYENLAFRGEASSEFTSNPTTFNDCAIGSASADRMVIVSVYGATESASVTMTIGGVSASLLAEIESNLYKLGIYSAMVPTGTTANIVISDGGSFNGKRIVWWTVDAYNISAGTPIENDIEEDEIFPVSGVTVPSGGFTLAVLGSTEEEVDVTINQSFVIRANNNNTIGLPISLAAADRETVMGSSTVTWDTSRVTEHLSIFLPFTPN